MTENNLKAENEINKMRELPRQSAVKAIYFAAQCLKAASEKDCLMADYHRHEAGKHGASALIIKRLLRL